MRSLLSCLLLSVVVASSAVAPSYGADADETEKFLLAAEIADGETTEVTVTLELGGDWIDAEATGTKKLPLTVTGELQYTEQLLSWDADATQPLRSLRTYQTAKAKIQKGKEGMVRELPEAKRLVVAEMRDEHAVLVGDKTPLTRDQFDLINIVGNSLALNRLLPGREMAEGESWDHDTGAIAALLGMDHVAACGVRSVVMGCEHHQVQIRMAGTIHGTVDGAPTEMELRGAYLFHQQQKRVTKFNLAIQEVRTASQIVPGLDVVAKVSVSIEPSDETLTETSSDNDHFSKAARDISQPLANTLLYEAPQSGYRFLHNHAWYDVTAEQSDLVSLRSLHNGNWTAHCNVTTLPARSEGNETVLEDFEHDVRTSLGENLEQVTASTEWTTAQGHTCMGVIATGSTGEVPIEWRYYLIASPGLPRVSLAVTIEKSQIEQFEDADRQMIDSLELLEKVSATASKPAKQSKR